MSLGYLEVVIILVVGLVSIGIPIATVVLLVFILRKPQVVIKDSSQLTQLREENERLRQELAAAKSQSSRSYDQ